MFEKYFPKDEAIGIIIVLSHCAGSFRGFQSDLFKSCPEGVDHRTTHNANKPQGILNMLILNDA